MTFKLKTIAGLVESTDDSLGTVGLGAKYGRVYGFRARNWASSAKAAAGSDNAQKVRLTDANSDIFFLDAIDRNYATAEVTLLIGYDDLNTGLGITPVTAIGSAWAATEGQSLGPPVVQSPITVEIVNGGTATDYFELSLLVEV